MNGFTLYQGDCLEVMRDLPDGSVDLILTDPPYFKVKGAEWDNQWSSSKLFLRWMDAVLCQFERILKPNGSLYVFASPKMAARVEVLVGDRFNVLSSITWNKRNAPGFDGWKQKTKKESLRKFYPHSERIVFAEKKQGLPDYSQQIRKQREALGLTQAEVCARLGFYGKVNRGGMLANWELGISVPSPEQWEMLQTIFDLQEFKHVVRPFFVTPDVPYTDVWEFETVRPYPGKHPCEKPVAMLEHIIKASSAHGGVVLDSFAGSGTTGVAALRAGRRFVGIERDEKYFEIAKQRILKDVLQ